MKTEQKNFVATQKFFIDELKLRGSELFIYSVVYGFAQNDETSLADYVKYLSEITRLPEEIVVVYLDSLVGKGLLEKTESFKDHKEHVSYQIKI
ncbi:MAG: hypothetical protein ACRCZB_05595 [Bacteroidales bacterium]